MKIGLLQLFDFLVSIQNRIGAGCKVSASTFSYGDSVPSLTIQADFPNGFHCRYTVSEHQLRTVYDVGRIEDTIVFQFQNDYKLFEVGEV